MKKIIICADGTWQSPESDGVTHILRIARGIAPEDTIGALGMPAPFLSILARVNNDWERVRVVD